MDIKELINQYIPDREAFYDYLVRERYFLPLEKCNIITVSFLDRVYREEIYLPKITDVRPIKVSKPPNKKLMQNELINILGQMNSEPAGRALI